MQPGHSKARGPSTDWTGQTLFGKWTIERLIGAGGTATVLQARHRNGRRAALKVLHPHLAAHGRTRERFLREGRLANLVNHPGVVAVLDDFVADDGSAVLVLELVRGQTLAALAKESGGFLEARDVASAACAVLEILAVAHDANVVHRDIKPENILRCEKTGYKLADFGLAALCHELGMLTGANASLGTPAYMSPEQARGDTRKIDARTDIWGLGATMFTLLTGRYLHAASAQKNLVVAAATEQAPPVLSLEPGMHSPLAEIVDRAVRVNKEERWPNARAMLAALQAIDLPASSQIRSVRAAPAGHEAATSTAPSSLLSRSRATWLQPALVGALIGGAVATAGVGAYWFKAGAAAPTEGRTSVPRQSVETASPALVSTTVPSPKLESPAVPASGISRVTHADERPSARPARAGAIGKTSSKAVPSAKPQASAVTRRSDLSVPDEILDRRD